MSEQALTEAWENAELWDRLHAVAEQGVYAPPAVAAALGWPDMPLRTIAEAEIEIAHRDLQNAYTRALCEVQGIAAGIDAELFQLVTAPPFVRVRAMLAVLGG